MPRSIRPDPRPVAPRFGVVEPTRPLPEPLDALARVAGPGAFLRHATGPGIRTTRWSFLALAPARVLEHQRLRGTDALREALEPLAPARVHRLGPRLPFAGGWAGLLGYEARSGVETRPRGRRAPLRFPAVWIGAYDAVLAWNHRTGRCYRAGLGTSRGAARAAARALEQRVRGARTPRGRRASLAPPRARRGGPAFERAVAEAREAVRAGAIFQANISERFDADTRADPVALFARLAASQPAPYLTYLDLGEDRQVLSASPERFVRFRGRRVETEPMKGTRPRGRTRREDRALRAELEACPKEQAELAMIVDLSRNDLARTCRAGTVRVRVPRRLIGFERVHQAIAIVEGRVRTGLDHRDVVAAAFPPGSVTGAPKVRAMEIIDDLEGEGRGPYCGALGWWDAGGDADLAVVIRTILLSRGKAAYRVGAGITLRSDPHDEWQETLAKGRGLFAALSGHEHEA